jgi:putative spermidine/putrescine transport system ATP-binding protein
MNDGASGGLELGALRKTYGSAVAVHGLSLSITPGEFLTLLGPSGSGKSTTLMMIAGFVDPDTGTIRLDGKDLTRVSAHRRSIGVVFQSYALFPHMTVLQNVAFALRMRDAPDQEVGRRVGAMIELMRLQGMEQRYPRELSGGQQQRVALARALVFEPSLLLLDEPLGALDRLLREHMKLELRRIHNELRTSMIYVTHDQDEALVLSDRIAVMNEGRIEQIGTPAAIYETPVNAFVARFIGESNFLRGRVSDISDTGATASVDGLAIRGRMAGQLELGEPVDVTIRPEKVTLARADAEASAYRGVITDAIYSGEAIRYSVQLGSASVVVKQSNRHGVFVPAAGEVVALAWHDDDVTLYPARDP